MIVMLHILIALASIAFTSFAYLVPSTIKLRVAYGLMALTLISGSYLVVSAPAHMLQSCAMGVVYLTLVTVGVVAARRKLAAAKVSV